MSSLYPVQHLAAIPFSGLLLLPPETTAGLPNVTTAELSPVTTADLSPKATAGTVSSLSSLSSMTKTTSLCLPVSLPQDAELLSPYQTLLRQQLEFFEATHDEVLVVQGRNKPVSLQQVGVRCRHCARRAVPRTIGSSYYPTRLESIYQSGQNIAKHHFEMNKCPSIPSVVQQLLMKKEENKGKSIKGRGKVYWAEAARELGIVERCGRLAFR